MTEKFLGQSRPSDTSNATVYTASGTSVVIKSMRICNTTSSDATCRIFLVPSGGTADQSTATYYDYTIPANSTLADDGYQVLEDGGSLVFRTDTANALTITACGAEV
jgi:hypothetical protein